MPQARSARRSKSRDRGRLDADERVRRAREAQEAATLVARQAVERATVRRDAVWRQAAEQNRRRSLTVLGAPFLPGVVLAVLGVFALALLVVGLVLLAGWAVVAVAAFRRAHSGEGVRLTGVNPDEAVERGALGALAAERLADVTESLCAALGLSPPELVVLVDPAPNAISAGSGEASRLVVTTGLVSSLERIELEAVLAHELAHHKRADTLSGGLSAALLRGGQIPGTARLASWLEGRDRELSADLAAVQVTRYPPGLVSALEKARSATTRSPATAVAAPVLAETASLWWVPLDEHAEGAREGAFGLDERLELLAEL